MSRSSAVPRTFHSSRRYDPSESLLGRAFRRWTGDRLRGEAFFLVALTGLALIILMVHYLGWALLEPYLSGSWARQMVFWGGQLLLGALWAATGLLGFRPGVRVTCTSDGLEVEQGSRVRSLAYDAIDEIGLISGVRYHRHYRLYAATAVYASHVGDDVLLLRTDEGPIVIALADVEAQRALKDQLETACTPARASAVPPDA